MRDAWPEVLASLQRTKRSAWMVAFTAQVREFRDGEVLVLAFPSEQDVAGFRGGAPGQSVSELLRSAIAEVLGVTVKFIAKVEGPAARGDGGARGGSDAATSDEGGAGSVPVPAETAPRRVPWPIRGARRVAACRVRRCIRIGVPSARSRRARPRRARRPRPPRTARPRRPPPHRRRRPQPHRHRGSAASAPTSAPIGTDGLRRHGARRPRRLVGDHHDPHRARARRAGRDVGRRRFGAPTATALAEAPVAASVAIDDVPDDADAPPDDVEPPFDPGPVPELVVEAPAPSPAPRGSGAAPADGGIQRYGESVVREVLGATFLEEVEAPGRPGFGERG